MPLDSENWQQLGELWLFALWKLAKPGHNHHNLDAALHEISQPGKT
ncbi:nitrate reductase associated protein [Cyanobium sp. WAJ14-Wanaka]|nr:nitrate reductase associated protein [Cyanobium sp. WAJ14-Wanaka]